MNKANDAAAKAKMLEDAMVAAPVPSAWRTIWNEIYKDKIALVALFLFVSILIAVFVLSAIVSGTPNTQTNLLYRNLDPSPEFILGTDTGGRGIFEMLVLGARVTFLIGFSVTILANIAGIMIGLVAGFSGGTTDNVIMRIVDTWQMLPQLMIIVVVVSMLPASNVRFVFIMAAFGWLGTARIMRAMALQQRNLDYVSASKTLGTRNIVIMFREVLPALVPTITTNLTLLLAANMGIEVGLTFLGFGLPPGTPSLGRLISLAQSPTVLQFRMHQWLPASLLVFTMMLCIYCVGQALSRASNVRSRRS